ncbi:hypothetical protein NDU88_000849 [Pleurodeles waltl]|uniref:Uncharacterized protein n=1 Tax=Pleurodeles waltl TaxID=8319 RepID=A0AAV7U4P9_PLEWA|nr:hypothetical protein NDU88_000849 [Pleurodeles waltl]
MAMKWRRLGGSSPRRKKSGVPRCDRGGGKRPGGFGEGEARGVRPVHRCGFSPRRCVPLPRPSSGSEWREPVGRAGPALHCVCGSSPRTTHEGVCGGAVALRPGTGDGPDAQRA